MNTKSTILIADGLAPEGVEHLESIEQTHVVNAKGITRDELKSALKDTHILIVRSRTEVDAELMEWGPQLKLVIRAGIGLDNVDVKAATAKGIVVMNAPTGNMVTTAEHAVAMMFALTRNIPQATSSMKAGQWEKNKFAGNEVRGKKFGVLGLGNIGSIAAQIAQGAGMKILAHDPFVSEESATKRGIELLSFEELLKQSDYLTVHVPKIESTYHLLNGETLRKMKKGAYLINCARGGIIDEVALNEVLNEGHLAGAALDVFETEPPEASNPLLSNDRVICTPHLGASTDEAQMKVGLEVADQIKQFLDDGVLTNAVNAPSVSLETLQQTRPYVNLCEKLGKFAGQVVTEQVERMKITFHGEVAEMDKQLLVLSLVKEFLSQKFDGTVNYVNAKSLLKQRGIQLEEASSKACSNYQSLVELSIEGKESFACMGTLFGKGESRIVSIDGFVVEASPTGNMLLTRNSDLPGVVGTLGSCLGDAGVNISQMALGLDRQKKEAIAVISTDSKVDAKTLSQLRQAKGMILVKQLYLD